MLSKNITTMADILRYELEYIFLIKNIEIKMIYYNMEQFDEKINLVNKLINSNEWEMFQQTGGNNNKFCLLLLTR